MYVIKDGKSTLEQNGMAKKQSRECGQNRQWEAERESTDANKWIMRMASTRHKEDVRLVVLKLEKQVTDNKMSAAEKEKRA